MSIYIKQILLALKRNNISKYTSNLLMLLAIIRNWQRNQSNYFDSYMQSCREEAFVIIYVKSSFIFNIYIEYDLLLLYYY